MTSENRDSFHYRAFISYSHRDEAWATWLHRRLERYRVPKGLVGRQTAVGPAPSRIFPVFRDREELPTAADLGAMIESALKSSEAMIVVCSPHAASSLWVDQEIRRFKLLGRPHRVQALIVSGEPNASDKPDLAPEECFPQSLRFALGPDGELTSERSEPIAADARPGKDGREDSFLKLVAGVLGIGYDELKRRELHRRRRRTLLFSSAGILLFMVMAALTGYALVSRDKAVAAGKEAERQRGIAVEASRQATAAQKEAERQRGLAEENAAQTRLKLGEIRLADAATALRDADWASAAADTAAALDLGVPTAATAMTATLAATNAAALETDLCRLPSPVVEAIPDPDGVHLAILTKDGRAWRYSLKDRAPTLCVVTGLGGNDHLLRADGRAVLCLQQMGGGDMVVWRDMVAPSRQPRVIARPEKTFSPAPSVTDHVVIQGSDTATVLDQNTGAPLGSITSSMAGVTTVGANGIVVTGDTGFGDVRAVRLSSGVEIASGKGCTWIGTIAGWPAWGNMSGELHLAGSQAVNVIPLPPALVPDADHKAPPRVGFATGTPDGSALAIVRTPPALDGGFVEVITRGTSKIFGTGIVAQKIALDSKARWLAAADASGHVVLWNLTKGTRSAAWTAHAGAVTALTFGEGGILVTAGADGRVRIWRPDLAMDAGIVQLPTAAIDGSGFAAVSRCQAAWTGNRLATCAVDNGKARVQWWQDGLQRETAEFALEASSGIALTEDGFAAVAGIDGAIRVLRPGSSSVRLLNFNRPDWPYVAWCSGGSVLLAGWIGNTLSEGSAYGFIDLSGSRPSFHGEKIAGGIAGIIPGANASGLIVGDDGGVYRAEPGRATSRVAPPGTATEAWARAGSGQLLAASARGWTLWSPEGRLLENGELPATDIQSIHRSLGGATLFGSRSSRLYVIPSRGGLVKQIDLSRERIADNILSDFSPITQMGDFGPSLGAVDVGWADEGRNAWVVLTDATGHNEIGLVDVTYGNILFMEQLPNGVKPRLVFKEDETAGAMTTIQGAALLPSPTVVSESRLQAIAGKKALSSGQAPLIDTESSTAALGVFSQLEALSPASLAARVEQSLALDPSNMNALLVHAWQLLKQKEPASASSSLPVLPSDHPWAPRCIAFTRLCDTFEAGKVGAPLDLGGIADPGAHAVATVAEIRAGSISREAARTLEPDGKNFDEIRLIDAMGKPDEFFPLLLSTLLGWESE